MKVLEGLNTDAATKYFGRSATLEKPMLLDSNYLFKLSKDNKLYTIKGYIFNLTHKSAEDNSAIKRLTEVLFKIAEIYQEYYLSKAANMCNTQFIKPLEIDQKAVLEENTLTHLYIEILYEYSEESFNFSLTSESMMRMIMDKQVNNLLRNIKDELSASKVKLSNSIQETITKVEKRSNLKKKDIDKVIKVLVGELESLINLATSRKITIKEENKEETKQKDIVITVCDSCKKDNAKISLSCGHNICKNCFEVKVIDSVKKEQPYNHSILCANCNKDNIISKFFT